ncbi:hypothetical protein [Flavobacterium selenitireducens]|uniref:hypothetical protein n=1 Tax=Flavobacterium selenitireducens TaxID=2722704 RepID=UPI00168B4CD5|nr:hypothetical protein [Flavobacterium selenitireducens]MBD3581108.1 hypothetical protein [Flavobacterium selenitireducens]
MKTLKFFTLAMLLSLTAITTAQVSVSVNINAPAPAWIAAPVPAARFYYLPDIQVYYDRPAAQFIYLHGGSWIRSRSLPAAYHGYDLHHGRTVCLTDYRGHAPYAYYNTHRVRYAGPRYHQPVRTVYVKEHRGHGHHKHHKKHHKHNKHRDRDWGDD